MPKVVVSADGAVVREERLAKECTTLGRRPYNDIVIDDLAVSGEHAVLAMGPEGVTLHDCDSTNGTLVNGRRIQRHLLQDHDVIEIARYRIRFIAQAFEQAFDKTMLVKAPASVLPPACP